MEATVSIKATPTEFRLLREAVQRYAEAQEQDGKLRPPGLSPAEIRDARAKAVKLRDLEGRL